MRFLHPKALLPCSCRDPGLASRPEGTHVGTGLSCQLHGRAVGATRLAQASQGTSVGSSAL